MATFITLNETCLVLPDHLRQLGVSRRISQAIKAYGREMARINLLAGYDVIIPQIYRHEEYLLRLEKVATEAKAKLFEIVLYVDKQEAVKRFMDRGGFHPGGLIDRGGGVKKLESMHDEMNDLIAKRPNTIKIEPVLGEHTRSC